MRANALSDSEITQAPALPWWAWRARLRQRWALWWQGRLPRTDTLLLTQRNVYILPTRAGWMLGVTLAVKLTRQMADARSARGVKLACRF